MRQHVTAALPCYQTSGIPGFHPFRLSSSMAGGAYVPTVFVGMYATLAM
jgi:hypothetical protein